MNQGVDSGPSNRKDELYASLAPAAWYVACAEREYQACDQLKKRQIEVWLPECKVMVTKRRSLSIVEGPLFPGYLFIRGVLTDEWLSAVIGARDVLDLLRVNSQPIAAREDQMQKLQQLVAESGGRVIIEHGRVRRGFDHVEQPTFTAGQALRVLDGAFAGFDALYKQEAGAERIKIFVDIFGRSTETEVDEASVEAVA